MSAPVQVDDRRQLMPAHVNYGALGFVVKNLALYQRIWTILGRTWTNLAAESVWATEHIPGLDHGKLNPEFEALLTDELCDLLMEPLTLMGMFRGGKAVLGKHDEFNVAGAKWPAMERRLRRTIPDLLSGRLEVDRMFYHVGQRPRTDWQDGTLDEIYATLTDTVKAHPWVIEEMKRLEPVAPEHFNDEQKSRFPKWTGPFGTEWKLGILAFLVATEGQFGEITFIPVREDDDSDNLLIEKGYNIPIREYMACSIRLSNDTEVVIINGPAVERPNREPRATTDSTTEYRLRYWPPELGASLLTVSGPVHGYRVLCSFERRVHTDFPDVEVRGIWESAGTRARQLIRNALAEMVWLLTAAYREYKTLI